MSALVIILGVVGTIVMVSILITVPHNRTLRLLAQDRQGDSICSFARSLDYRRLDTTIIRAVYEGLQDYLNHVCRAFPVRPTDDIEKVYRIDPEDYEELVLEIAERTGRSLEDYKRNPYYHQISTVTGLIEFLCAQPMVRGA